MDAFLAMGGYAAYVWSSYGITGIVMLVLYLHARRREKKQLRQIHELATKKEKWK